jgi:hypothetical protein
MDKVGILEEYHYTPKEITSQMARRFVWQQNKMSKSDCESMTEESYMVLPKRWIDLAEEWGRVHGIDTKQCLMALLHLRSYFGENFDVLELWVILDVACEEAKTI